MSFSGNNSHNNSGNGSGSQGSSFLRHINEFVGENCHRSLLQAEELPVVDLQA